MVGALGAIALALVMMPLREHTSASNLGYAFLVLTLVVAEAGGRGPGLVTAFMSALSLNFFLTAPYLTLVIDDPDDIVAFLALAASGLIAPRSASGGNGRRRRPAGPAGRSTPCGAWSPTSRRTSDSTGCSTSSGKASASAAWWCATPPGTRLPRARPAPRPPPGSSSTRTACSPSTTRRHRWNRGGFRLPEDGGRVALRSERGHFWLDLWEGDPEGLDAYDRQALTVAAAILAREISRERPAP